jgi:hemolysin type calcium-binding protein
MGPRSLIGVVAAAVTLTLASSALAATVRTVRKLDARGAGLAQWIYEVNVEDREGERNRLEIEPSGEGVVVRDTLRLKARGRRCTSLAPRRVRCEVADEIAIRAGAKDDSVTVSPDDDITSFDPYPTALAGPGTDSILLDYGGTAYGGAGHDVVKSGADGVVTDQPFTASGGVGPDRLYGGAGRDFLMGDAGSDRLLGGAGDDFLTGGTLTGGASGRDAMFGGEGDDFLSDNDVAGSCEGGRVGPDTIVGGADSDRVGYISRAEPVVVDLGDPASDGQLGEGDSLTEVEEVYGGCGDDRLIGDDYGNELIGGYGSGRDVMLGRGGPDLIHVTAGDDAAGESGDDELRMFEEDSSARATCGEGDDRATANVGYAPTDGSAAVPGILIPPDCERLHARYTDENLTQRQLELDPVPEAMSADGDLVFPLFSEETGDYAFALTDDEPPFEEFDSEPLAGDEVTLTAPPHVVESAATAPVTLRGVTLGGKLVWRFRVQRG